MEAREQEFLEYVQGGGLVETDDWMPDEYRARLIKFIEMHGNSELMGVLPERDWILRAPTLLAAFANAGAKVAVVTALFLAVDLAFVGANLLKVPAGGDVAKQV